MPILDPADSVYIAGLITQRIHLLADMAPSNSPSLPAELKRLRRLLPTVRMLGTVDQLRETDVSPEQALRILAQIEDFHIPTRMEHDAFLGIENVDKALIGYWKDPEYGIQHTIVIDGSSITIVGEFDFHGGRQFRLVEDL